MSIDPESGTPIYLQLIEQVRHAVSIGFFKPGDPLPTIRELALQLRINPNTVAKAIRELERDGVLVTRVGKGSFVSDEAPQKTALDKLGKGTSLASKYGQDMRWLGFDRDGSVELIRQTWKEESHD